MSLLAASRRATRSVVASSPLTVARRCLGDGVRGPPLGDFAGNLRSATDFFAKGSVSYVEFKQQCMSLRLFVFAGVTGACALSLCWSPPKSSYWQRYSPSYWFFHLRSAFSSSSEPLFLKAKAESSVDVPDVVTQLVTTRRVKGQEAEEH
eukprot:TRINITY_DN2102_c0_g2_i1.p1 TRINITY_DN2102_c0_g2~~TRINITY_DN2102_c0_g2_i1.p1  ORF type:complete len:150 (-),score=26.84 TRINITY_DN2102_c0_g2_i1:212-661(-)